VDASSYGRLVERGGYATGGTVQSTGFTLIGEAGCEFPAALLRAIESGFISVQLQPPGAHDPDDGTAGVPARI